MNRRGLLALAGSLLVGEPVLKAFSFLKNNPIGLGVSLRLSDLYPDAPLPLIVSGRSFAQHIVVDISDVLIQRCHFGNGIWVDGDNCSIFHCHVTRDPRSPPPPIPRDYPVESFGYPLVKIGESPTFDEALAAYAMEDHSFGGTS